MWAQSFTVPSGASKQRSNGKLASVNTRRVQMVLLTGIGVIPPLWTPNAQASAE
jgi:hypothetical protein